MIKEIISISFFIGCASIAQQNDSFIVFSDTHHYSPDLNFRESILYEIALQAIDENVDFVFHTGDLVLRDGAYGTDYDSLLYDWNFILDTLDVNGIRLFACRGNNDVSSSEAWTSLFRDEYALPDNGPDGEKYYTYSFAYNNFMFMSLDQYTDYNRVNQPWIDEQLTKNDKPFVFAASHEPAFEVYHKGLSIYPEERDSFWTSFTEMNGKIYFCGHDHFYDHSLLADEDDFPGNDAHQIIAGTGGGYIHFDSTYASDNGRWQPQAILHEESYGYVLVKVSETGFQTIWKHRTAPFEYEEGGDNYSYGITTVESDIFPPNNFRLYQNYPNPFNPATTIEYSLPAFQATNRAASASQELRGELVNVQLKIYDILGREIAILVDAEKRPGNYEVKWNSAGFSSGVYFYRMTAGTFTEIKKMILLR